MSRNKKRRNSLIDNIIADYHVNSQYNRAGFDEEKDKYGNILVFEMPNIGGMRKSEQFIVDSMGIDGVDGSHKYLSSTIRHAVSLQHNLKAVVVKNVENILQIERCTDRYQIMATLVNIQNSFGRPTIFTGSPEGLMAISMTEQHEVRFLCNTFLFEDEVKK